MFKFRKLALFFALTYIFFLPFIKVGVSVSYFCLTIADMSIILAALTLALRYVLRRDLHIPDNFREFFAVLIVFILTLFPSVFSHHFKTNLFLELLPYFHSFLVFTCFVILFFNDFKLSLGKVSSCYLFSFLISCVPMMLGMYFNTTLTPWLRIFFNDGQKYQFLCKSPNQYSFFVVVAIMFAILHEKLPFLIRILTLGMGGAAIFLSGSRGGAVIFLLLSSYFILSLLVKAVKIRKERKNVIISILLVSVFIFSIIPYLSHRFWNTGRSLSGINLVLKGQYGDSYRKEQFKQAWALFKDNPVAGIGPGNFMKISPDAHEIHNSLLAILTESGLIGFAGLLLLQFFFFRTVARSDRKLSLRIDGYAILTVCLLSMVPHHIIRERWLWLIYIILVIFFERSKPRQENVRNSGISG